MQDYRIDVRCLDAGATISAVLFSSYGTPSGSCPAFVKGTCDAANSTSVAEALCLGRNACRIFPNTTTFADPCFGTPKVMDIALACNTGPGEAVCGVPPAPSLPNFTATVAVDFSTTIGAVNIAPSIQVVSQHFLWRDSPVHDQAFATLRQLGARNVRWVPWLPYAAYGVGELMPPSMSLCGPQNWQTGSQVEPITLDCGTGGGTIESIDFASFGQPTGNCGAYAKSACHAASSIDVVAALCLGKASCVVPTDAAAFGGSPCAGANFLAVSATCSSKTLHTYWNFTLPDAFFTDFWQAVDGDNSEPVPNFSTQPTWFYSPSDYNWPASPDQPVGYPRGPASACNNSLLGEYYGRLQVHTLCPPRPLDPPIFIQSFPPHLRRYGYFKTGSMVDEAGVTHTRPAGPSNISIIEVFNEVDYEHGYACIRKQVPTHPPATNLDNTSWATGNSSRISTGPCNVHCRVRRCRPRRPQARRPRQDDQICWTQPAQY